MRVPPGPARLLRIYLKNDARVHGKRLHELVLERALALGVAGGAVFPAEVGYGEHGLIHDDSNEYTQAGAPLVAEFVDRAESIEALIADLAPLRSGYGFGPWTIRDVLVVSPIRAGNSESEGE